jgi:CubicO group peptidase (beta-lactamase class C family)
VADALFIMPSRDLEAVDYKPLARDDWMVSTPAEQGLDPNLVAELYADAAELSKLYGLLVVKNGQLIAEGYFNASTVDSLALVQSVSKSYNSALVGIALARGCLSSVDQEMLEFFPELADQVTDPRKEQITIRQLLQMRGGYPWEETDPALWEIFVEGDYIPLIEGFALVSDPGAEFHYSNFTSWLLGVIAARACDTDLKAFAREHLFSPMDAGVGEWYEDPYGYYYSLFSFTARDMARFGQLYLDGGTYESTQVIPADWIRASLQVYSEDAHITDRVGSYVGDIGYGYQWWSATAGDHRFDFAWGHGGQLIVLLHELDMVIVVTSDPFFLEHTSESWMHEVQNIDLVGKFIQSLPTG